MLVLAFCIIVGLTFNYFIVLNTWFKLIFVGGFSTLLSGMVVTFVVLGKGQRARLISTIVNRRK